MDDDNLRARVFISCGQRKDTEEVLIAQQIADVLSKKGFLPYIAVEEQSLRGLKENIFGQLESSEYFVFIDFKRERILMGTDEVCRGSLFCHQELAIASFLDIPVLAFHEEGVKREDGLSRFLQANSQEFRERKAISGLGSNRRPQF